MYSYSLSCVFPNRCKLQRFSSILKPVGFFAIYSYYPRNFVSFVIRCFSIKFYNVSSTFVMNKFFWAFHIFYFKFQLFHRNRNHFTPEIPFCVPVFYLGKVFNNSIIFFILILFVETWFIQFKFRTPGSILVNPPLMNQSQILHLPLISGVQFRKHLALLCSGFPAEFSLVFCLYFFIYLKTVFRFNQLRFREFYLQGFNHRHGFEVSKRVFLLTAEIFEVQLVIALIPLISEKKIPFVVKPGYPLIRKCNLFYLVIFFELLIFYIRKNDSL